ncbi:hypothetical protein PROFUN_15248, partial [Planoprotostelium fungivorum]
NEAIMNALKGHHEEVIRLLLNDPRVKLSPDVIDEAVREAYADGQVDIARILSGTEVKKSKMNCIVS